jgi:hypothetical protein
METKIDNAPAAGAPRCTCPADETPWHLPGCPKDAAQQAEAGAILEYVQLVFRGEPVDDFGTSFTIVREALDMKDRWLERAAKIAEAIAERFRVAMVRTNVRSPAGSRRSAELANMVGAALEIATAIRAEGRTPKERVHVHGVTHEAEDRDTPTMEDFRRARAGEAERELRAWRDLVEPAVRRLVYHGRCVECGANVPKVAHQPACRVEEALAAVNATGQPTAGPPNPPVGEAGRVGEDPDYEGDDP